MSYRLRVIKDNPIGFWPLDDIAINAEINYTDLTSKFATYQELKDYYLQYSDITLEAIDISGCGNTGFYNGDYTSTVDFLPLISGGGYSINIDSDNHIEFPIIKDYYGSTAGGSIADKYSTDNDFSLEFWFYPKITTNNLTPLFADTDSNVGAYYKNGNIVFKVGSQELNYTIPYIKKAHHIVVTYSVDNIKIYHDGQIVNSKFLNEKISLTNTSTRFFAGPTLNAQDSFLIDAPAVYRYALTKEIILSHYNYGQTMSVNQVVAPENGILFSLNDENIKRAFSYSYPIDKSWENFVNDDIVFNSNDQSISILSSDSIVSKTATFEDYITFPTNIGIEFSKIEWSGENGITVETSVDGNTYVQCINGESIPQYQFGNFDESGKIYIKFTLSTTDASKYIPKLKYLAISLFKSKDIYADNYGDTITYSQDEYFLGNRNYNLLSRDYRNGLRVKSGNGFVLNTASSISTVELFYTPLELDDSGFISSQASSPYAASNYSWAYPGSISKTNISAIYVNGVNKTSETSINNVFSVNELHHVVIVFSNPISNNIVFNYKSTGAQAGIYKNIALYSDQFIESKALNHYNLYVEKPAEQILANNTAISVTENAAVAYNNDWIVIQSS